MLHFCLADLGTSLKTKTFGKIPAASRLLVQKMPSQKRLKGKKFRLFKLLLAFSTSFKGATA